MEKWTSSTTELVLRSRSRSRLLTETQTVRCSLPARQAVLEEHGVSFRGPTRPRRRATASAVDEISARMRALATRRPYWNGESFLQGVAGARRRMERTSHRNGGLRRPSARSSATTRRPCGLLFAAMQRRASNRSIYARHHLGSAEASRRWPVSRWCRLSSRTTAGRSREWRTRANALVGVFRERDRRPHRLHVGLHWRTEGILHDCDRVLRSFSRPDPGGAPRCSS